MKKKFFSLLLMLVVGIIGAWADDVTVPTPVYFNDFSSTNDLTIVGSGEFITDDDSHFGQIYHNDPALSKSIRTNYLKLPTSCLNGCATNKAMTIGFWVNKKSATDYYWSPVFTAYGAAPDASTGNTWPMFCCTLRGTLQENSWGYCDFGSAYNDKVIAGTATDNAASTAWSDDGEWHYFTITLTETTAAVYVDGNVLNSWTVDGTSDGQVISGLFLHPDNTPYICLGGNQAWTWNDPDPAFGFDDFAVYSAALSAEQIQKIMAEKEKDKVGTRNAATGACTGTYDTDVSSTYTLESGKRYHFNFTNYNSISAKGAYDATTNPTGVGNWNNWILGCKDGSNKLFMLRNDNWDDVALANTNCVSNFDWANFMTDMNGATVDMYVTFANSTVSVSSTITTTANKTYTYSYTKSDVSASSVDLYFTVNASQIVMNTAEDSPYAITYHNNDHGTCPDATTGYALPNPLPTMTEDGYSFDGWFTDEALSTAAVASAAITAATDLYAKWTQVTLAAPSIAQAAGTTNDKVTITLTSDQSAITGTPTATIKYIVNGGDEQTYSAAFDVIQGSTIKAWCTATNYLNSATSSATAYYLNGFTTTKTINLTTGLTNGSGANGSTTATFGSTTLYQYLGDGTTALDENFYVAGAETNGDITNHFFYREYGDDKGLYCFYAGERKIGLTSLTAGQVVKINATDVISAGDNASALDMYNNGQNYYFKVTADGTSSFTVPRYTYIHSIEVLTATNEVVGDIGFTTGYFTTWNKTPIQIQKGASATYTFINHNKGAQAATYQNWYLFVANTSSENKTVLRADNAVNIGEGTFSNSDNYNATNVKFATDLEDATVVLTVTYNSDGSITSTAKTTKADGTTLPDYVYTQTGYTDDALNIYLSVENSWLEVVSQNPATTLTYHSDYGTVPGTAMVAALPTPLPTLTVDNYTFEGWYTDEGLTTAAVAGKAITTATDLYAKWIGSNWTADFSTVTGASDKAAPTLTTATTISSVNYGTVVLGSTSFDSRLALAENGSWMWRSSSKALQNAKNGTRNLLVMNAKAGQYIQLNSNLAPVSVSNATLQSTNGNVRTYKVDVAGNVMFGIDKTKSDGSQYSYVYSIKVFDGYSWTAKNSLDDVLASGYVTKGESATVAYPLYINVNGTLYTKTATDKTFAVTFTPNADDYVYTLEYTKTSITNVVYFSEGENIEGATATNAGSNMWGRSSNQQCAYAASDITLVTLPAGTYTVTSVQYSNSSSGLTLKYQLGNKTIENKTSSSSNWDAKTNEFTLTSDAVFKWLASGDAKNGLDFIYITGTPTNEIVGALDYSTGYLYDNSTYVTLKKGESYHYRFVNHKTGSNNWQNWVLPIYNNPGGDAAWTKIAVIRADNWDDVGGESSKDDFTSDFVWTNFNTEMNGATIDLDITYTSKGAINMTSTISTSAGNTWTYAYTKTGLSYDNITTALSVSSSWLEILSEGSIPGTSIARTTTKSKYGTICLPYDFTATGASLYIISEISSSGVLTLTEKGTTGTKGVPYIYNASADAQTFKHTPCNIVTAPTAGDNGLTGCFEATDVPAGSYVMQTLNNRQGFYQVETANTIQCGANKCYLNYTKGGSVRAFYFDGEGEETAISTVNALLNGDNKIYDLNGRQLQHLQKGINIVNGKKIIVK